jgi:hypothetical protein
MRGLEAPSTGETQAPSNTQSTEVFHSDPIEKTPERKKRGARVIVKSGSRWEDLQKLESKWIHGHAFYWT